MVHTSANEYASHEMQFEHFPLGTNISHDTVCIMQGWVPPFSAISAQSSITADISPLLRTYFLSPFVQTVDQDVSGKLSACLDVATCLSHFLALPSD